MCNVNVVNKIICSWLIIFFLKRGLGVALAALAMPLFKIREGLLHDVSKNSPLFNCLTIITTIFIILYPNAINDPKNFTEANPLTTPTHIQPE